MPGQPSFLPLSKRLSFGVQKITFCPPVCRLLQPEMPPFATRLAMDCQQPAFSLHSYILFNGL
jgi:hypothetical protein